MKTLEKVEWCKTEETSKPDVSFVPPMERRRLTLVERAMMSVAYKALTNYRQRTNDTADIPVVFASRWGEIGTTIKLMKQMFEEGEMSPAGFSNSVHNAAPGHFSLFTKNHASYTAIAAGENSYEMGLLEASTYDDKVLFVYAEEDTPEMYQKCHPDCQVAHAVAMIIDNGE